MADGAKHSVEGGYSFSVLFFFTLSLLLQSSRTDRERNISELLGSAGELTAELTIVGCI
jgi:hypothetical protein